MSKCEENRNFMDELYNVICEIDSLKLEPEVCNVRCPPLGCPRGPCPGTCCNEGILDPCCVSKMPCDPSPPPRPSPRCCAPHCLKGCARDAACPTSSSSSSYGSSSRDVNRGSLIVGCCDSAPCDRSHLSPALCYTPCNLAPIAPICCPPRPTMYFEYVMKPFG